MDSLPLRFAPAGNDTDYGFPLYEPKKTGPRPNFPLPPRRPDPYIDRAGLRGALGVHIPRGLIDPEGSCP